MTETLGEKLIRCGWADNFNVKTLVRLIEEHFSSRIPSTQTPISVNDRLPGPDDCDVDGKCWFWATSLSGWLYRDAEDVHSGISHWLPYNAIQIPTSTKTTNDN
jgi:hypothetical protein